MQMPDRRLTQSGLPLLSKDEQKERRARLARQGVLTGFTTKIAPLENFIIGSANCLYEFFHANGYMIRRTEWDQRAIVPALLQYHGWVYALYGEDEQAVYVGETGRSFRERFEEHEREESKKWWWKAWTAVKVLPCPDQSRRKLFESLIGLAGGYYANKMQPAGPDNLFDDVVLSLLLLENDDREPLAFPNDMVRDTAGMLSDLLADRE
jgi:hypothetical protein